MTSMKCSMTINPHNDKKYLIVSSIDNPEILINYKTLKVRFVHDNNDISNLLNSNRYFIVAGGCQICTGYYRPNVSILPCENVPFGLLTYQSINFIFEIGKLAEKLDLAIDNVQIHFDIINSIKLVDKRWGFDAFDWITKLDDDIKEKITLRFMCGMCGIAKYKEFPNQKYDIIRINDIDICTVDTKEKEHQYDNVYFEVQDMAISLLFKCDKNILYEKCYYKFNTKSETFEFPKYFFEQCGDSITSISLINHNMSEITPTIIVGDTILENKITKINMDNNHTKYIYDEFSKGDIWINILCMRFRYSSNTNYKNNITICGLDPGLYELEYVKIYCQRDIRRKLAQTPGFKAKPIKNGSINDVLIFN